MALYTYEQFEKAAKDSGMYEQFSVADLELAKQNPDAGMSILSYKQDYANATTDEARALANAGAEKIRSDYGGYTGGSTGAGFVVNPMSPSSFAPSTAAPSYSSRYDASMQQMLNSITNREEFSYDATTDPLAGQYRKTYAREGERATQNALGAAAAATGGIPSSYAATAAAQAGNYYAAQMADKIPELYEMAYNRYLNEFNMDLSSFNALQSAEQLEYDKYLAQLGQWNTDREFQYNQMLDELNARDQAAATEFEKALYAAQYGDYSYLNNLGINTDNVPEDWERQYELAVLAAQYGDYSGLKALGIDTSALEAAAGETAGGSGGSGGGSGGSGGGGTGGTDGGTSEGKVYNVIGANANADLLTNTVPETYTDAEADAALQRALANGGKVTSRSDWAILANRYGGKAALEAEGIYWAGY